MKPPMQPVVALELITTGPDPYADGIVDLGALVWESRGVSRCFGELVRPAHMPKDPFFTRHPELSADMLQQARAAGEVLNDLLAFLPAGVACISYHAETVRTFLQAATLDRFLCPVVDTRELAKICFPNLPSYTLPDVIEAMGMAPAAGAFSLSCCEDTLQLWRRIVAEARSWPGPLLDEIGYLLTPLPRRPFHTFFRGIRADDGGQERDGTRFIALFNRAEKIPTARRELSDPAGWVPLDENRAVSSLERNGEFEQKLPGYEFRGQQIAMARAVVNAFNTSTHLLVEAGTGIGKSLAYLVPSVLWATANRAPVVVSTNTKNLQTQLYKKDIPLIRQALGIDFHAAIIKGRRNYLCLRKLLYLLDHAGQELNDTERLRLVRVLVWAVQSDTGDMSESAAVEEPGAPLLSAQLSSAAEECLGAACGHRGRCFLYRARARSLGADIVVANHSIVFSEMENTEGPSALPAHAHLVFDEAHNIEDAATNWLAVEVSQTRLRFFLGRLLRTGRRQKASGLLPAVRHELAGLSPAAKKTLPSELERHVDIATSAVEDAEPPVALFFETLRQVHLGETGDRLSVRIKTGVDPTTPTAEEGDPPVPAPTARLDPALEQARNRMLSALAEVVRRAKTLVDTLRQEECAGLAYRSDFIQDIGAASLAIEEFSRDTAFVTAANSEGTVFWVERSGRLQDEARAMAAPIRLGTMLAEQLYADRRSIVFSSATLTVNGSFGFLKRRLGLDLLPSERVTELNVGTPFDYRRQCAVLAPMFLPEPNTADRDYAVELGDLLADVFRRTRGRGMALFTSYSMLKRTTAVLAKALAEEGIAVLAQGESGTRENITEMFRRDLESVLMGTQSFWEGVDVAGETLSCLVVTRLPFAVHTDPIVEARCEQVEAEGDNAFVDYSVPSAVIKFRQGFGRLIRHRTDRGIVIVTDRRIFTKRYGKWFRGSIPASTISFDDRARFLDAIEEFMRTAVAGD